MRASSLDAGDRLICRFCMLLQEAAEPGHVAQENEGMFTESEPPVPRFGQQVKQYSRKKSASPNHPKCGSSDVEVSNQTERNLPC